MGEVDMDRLLGIAGYTAGNLGKIAGYSRVQQLVYEACLGRRFWETL